MLFLVKLNQEFSGWLLEVAKSNLELSLFFVSCMWRKTLLSCRFGRTAKFSLPLVMRAQPPYARRYCTGTSVQWRLKPGNIITKRRIIMHLKRFLGIGLSIKLVPVQYLGYVRSEANAFRVDRKQFENELFKNNDLTIIMWFSNPKWPLIVAFSNSSGVVWTENIWRVFRVKPPFSNSSGVVWARPQISEFISWYLLWTIIYLSSSICYKCKLRLWIYLENVLTKSSEKLLTHTLNVGDYTLQMHQQMHICCRRLPAIIFASI